MLLDGAQLGDVEDAAMVCGRIGLDEDALVGKGESKAKLIETVGQSYFTFQ
jgi:hypothetical protein